MPTTVIPFGADTVTAAQLDRTDAGVSYRLPSVTVQSGRALRLNSGGLVFGNPPPLEAMQTVPDQLAFLRGHFQHYCGIWGKHARLFIELYFDFIEHEIDAHRAELDDRLKRFGSLYTANQWAFSAFRPLPRAHLIAPEHADATLPDSLIRTDIAFWTADGAVVIDLIGSSTRTSADTRRRNRLDAAGIRVVSVPHKVLTDAESTALGACLPEDFHAFWRHDALPVGPFRATSEALVLPG
jgi:hypothetical protein